MLHLPDVVPGMIAAIQTFGQLLHWNPHIHYIHSLVTCGAYTPEGEFLHLPEFDMDRLLLAWQEAVFSLYLSDRKIEPDVVAKEVRKWLDQADVQTLFTAKGSPWENGYVESFNGRLRDELLNGELFLSLAETRWVIDRWRLDYNHRRPRSLDYQTPAAYAVGCVLPASATPQPPEHSRVT